MKEERPDHDLLRDVAAGSKAALGVLYARHAGRILGFLKRLLGDAGSAEDIVHDVFLEVWRSAARFQGRSSVSTWMLSIARNKAIDELRKKKPDGNLEDREAGSTPEQDLMELSGSRYLRSMVDRLSHEHREIIYLVYYSEKSISEISE